MRDNTKKRKINESFAVFKISETNVTICKRKSGISLNWRNIRHDATFFAKKKNKFSISQDSC